MLLFLLSFTSCVVCRETETMAACRGTRVLRCSTGDGGITNVTCGRVFAEAERIEVSGSGFVAAFQCRVGQLPAVNTIRIESPTAVTCLQMECSVPFRRNWTAVSTTTTLSTSSTKPPFQAPAKPVEDDDDDDGDDDDSDDDGDDTDDDDSDYSDDDDNATPSTTTTTNTTTTGTTPGRAERTIVVSASVSAGSVVIAVSVGVSAVGVIIVIVCRRRWTCGGRRVAHPIFDTDTTAVATTSPCWLRSSYIKKQGIGYPLRRR